MNVLVTGGCGFIGSHTVDLLVEQGYKTIVIDKIKPNEYNPRVLYYQADITHPHVLEQIFAEHTPGVVIHLAAQVSVDTSMKDPLRDVNENVVGTIKLLEQCRSFQTKIIFASSAAVYGLPMHLPILEEHSTNPISIYGLSKLTVEKYIQLYYQQFGVEFCILRYANVYGPRQGSTGEGGVISIFADRLSKGQTPILFGNGNQTRDFVYVDDVARANLYALKRGTNQIFNVSTMTETSVNQIVKILQERMDNQSGQTYLPARTGDIPRSILDSTEIRTLLGWEPKVDIKTGLTLTIDYFTRKSLFLQ